MKMKSDSSITFKYIKILACEEVYVIINAPVYTNVNNNDTWKRILLNIFFNVQLLMILLVIIFPDLHK